MRTVVGLYDRIDDAYRVVDALVKEGVSRDRIGIVARDSEGQYARSIKTDKPARDKDVTQGAAAGAGVGAAVGGLGGLLAGLGALMIPGIGPVIAAGPIVGALAGAGVGAAAGGVLGALIDLGIPEETAHVYAEGVRRGGTLVYATIDEAKASQVAQIMNRFNPVDINQRAQNWRSNKWNRFDPKSKELSTKEIEQERSRYASEVPVTGERDMTIPVVEEDVRIGKREVDKGGLHINTYTTEREVKKDVNLRDEHINVERRPVDRPATDRDFENFKEGSMELHETTEEPIVDKRARVVEEVHIDKDVEERTETISETVRRKDVDVEKMGKTGDWAQYETMFRTDYQSRFGSRGHDFDYYLPAYRYGYELRSDPRFSRYNNWSQLESEARREWQHRGERSSWDDVKDAIRYGWESFRR
jgi:uncharacterized protein (TIGR02271 family)